MKLASVLVSILAIIGASGCSQLSQIISSPELSCDVNEGYTLVTFWEGDVGVTYKAAPDKVEKICSVFAAPKPAALSTQRLSCTLKGDRVIGTVWINDRSGISAKLNEPTAELICALLTKK